MTFKENWEKVDETCPQCGQVTKKQKGLTKQNIKKLFSFNWNYDELQMTLIIIMILFLAWSYKHDTQVCRDYVQQKVDEFKSMNQTIAFNADPSRLNYWNLTITNDTNNTKIVQ